MSGYVKFQSAILEATRVHLGPLPPDDPEALEALGEAIQNLVLGRNGPTGAKRKRDRTEKDQFIEKMFLGFLEIANSLETLEDIAFYVGRFPFQKTRITPERYLRFHVEAWLAEVYILQERLTSYLKVVERQHKKDPHLPAIRGSVKNLEEMLRRTLKGVVDVRRQHVHRVRFSDEELDRLSYMEAMSHGPDDGFSHLMRLLHHNMHRKVKKTWKDRILNNNIAIRELLYSFFDGLFPVVFDEQTKALKYPNPHRT
jgi:hypothetical protein